MLPKGERKMGILRNQDVIFFSRLKIKHKFKKKGGENGRTRLVCILLISGLSSSKRGRLWK